MRTLLLAAALAVAAPSEPAAPTGAFGLVVRDAVDDRLVVEGILSVREDRTFLLECRISGPAAGTDTKTAVWGTVDVSGSVVTGRVDGGEDRLQLPGRRFILPFGDPRRGWESNIPGCPQVARVPR
jgi:hypothetical protein